MSDTTRAPLEITVEQARALAAYGRLSATERQRAARLVAVSSCSLAWAVAAVVATRTAPAQGYSA